MGLFNRYDLPSRSLESAFREYCDMYCNPKDYSVTEDDCIKYLKDLEKAYKLNYEWNEKRRSNWTWTTLIIGAILTILIPSLVFIWLDSQDSKWTFISTLVSSWIILGLSIWIFNKVDEYLRLSMIYLSKFYPPKNENIEKLFDDYLWKDKMLTEAKSKGIEERRKTYDRIVRMSHPGLDDFKEAIERELINPSEECVFGDVKFGMTAEEIYKTKVFAGLSLNNSNDDISLGFRENYLGRYFAIQDSCVSFQFDNNRLVKSIIYPLLSCVNKEAVIEPFISCCEKLNQYYGNPCNLRRRFKGEGLELVPYDKAVFRVGKKSVLLHIEKSDYIRYNIKIEFLIATSANNCGVDDSNQPFDRSWFDTLRKLHSPKESDSSGPFDDNNIPF
ncbi:hypothetical protein SAMN04487901_11511 [Prevotella communis]|uniref:Uncharacterized protein n=1 Tax=Prevotella communis TaxID=2913614 RepID=A0A1G7Z2A0_9BACT|nr:hypothetical protein SAMN04487901_11511 [Prevotella communis]